MEKIINIFFNDNVKSFEAFLKLKNILNKKGFIISDTFNENAILNICIGGDGSFIRGVHHSNFSKIPFVGINTGKLGFYQEINLENIEKFVDDYIKNNYSIEKIRILECDVNTKKLNFSQNCLNEFVIRSNNSEIIHLDIYIDGNHLETFAGDGIIISTPSGSTAYNMSAGGSIMYPTLKGFQLTALSPIFSKVYRSLSNSIVIPNTSTLKVVPLDESYKKIAFTTDGMDRSVDNISFFNFKKSYKKIYKLMFNKDWYWINMKDKFL